MRCSAINLGISDYDIFNPEEARYITNKEKKEKSIEIRPNITIRELINLFKLKYSIMIDFINSGNLVISSPLEDEEEDFDSKIKDLYSRKAKINIESLKYIELKIVAIDKNIKFSIPLVKCYLNKEKKALFDNEEKIIFRKIKKDSLL